MGLNVLLVDDSGVMRKLISRSLRQAGLAIAGTVEASNGEEALSALNDNEIDIVLCDWNMPVMDGPTFVQSARASHDVAIVMLTTETASEKIALALKAGADGYVTKPFTPDKLAEKISLVLEHKRSA